MLYLGIHVTCFFFLYHQLVVTERIAPIFYVFKKKCHFQLHLFTVSCGKAGVYPCSLTSNTRIHTCGQSE